MLAISWPGSSQWLWWQKPIFRFFFIYFLLIIQPWALPEYIPGVSVVYTYYHDFWNWMVESANKYLFKTYDTLVYPNGSGDTSYNWTEVKLLLIISLVGTIIWSFIDRKRNNYNRLAYFIRIIVRYFLAIQCFGYGIIKIYAAQMSFPSLSQLATPLGDFLPMRLSWMFMGYSEPYQQFSGIMETLAGILLLYRRTASFGTLLAAGIFCNVVMMNLSYDIPVKLFSSHLFAMCLFLLAFESRRLLQFFVLSKGAEAASIYEIKFPAKWMRISRIIFKLVFIALIAIIPLVSNFEYYKEDHSQKDQGPIPSGVYDVAVFALDKDTLPALITDTLRWNDMIFERTLNGSVLSMDTIFRRRYNRGYFNYKLDTASRQLVFSKSSIDSGPVELFRAKFELPDSNTVILQGTFKQKSLYALLKRSKRHFQLAERQFHWLSEYNR